MEKYNKFIDKHISLLLSRYPVLESCKDSIVEGYLLLEECYKKDGKLLIAGNGGSAADAEHIAGELMKKFMISRRVTDEFADKLKDVDPVIGSYLSICG